MNPAELLRRSALWSQPPLAVAADLVMLCAFVLIAAAVVADFRSYHRQDRRVVRSGRSFVETGTMTAFFVAYYLVTKLRWLEVRLPGPVRTALIIGGLVIVVTGVVFNLWGRIVLKARWANQIEIIEGHSLATNGPFAVTRHPLYASLIWIFIGGALVYANLLSLLITIGVFVPMMYIRAKKEDALLSESFGSEFEEYRKRVGMFFPRVWG